ncbi:MAG TPA: prepilin-type cleavage/methylation domain-containing protein [Anaeromyxobacteraceae bacterium]|nr:prepilin-type cleavage/methylation domain-containing protein [Anaeromyxobacteraceae bacterium]
MIPGSRRGFTLIELTIISALVLILAFAAFATFRAAKRNSSVSAASWDVALRVQGLRAQAMAEQRDLLAVVVDAPANDAGSCGFVNDEGCARIFVLAEPLAAWTLGAFDPAAPGTNAQYLDHFALPQHVRFHLPAAGEHPGAPFDNVTVLDAELTAACPGERRCFAIRFGRRGVVSGEFPAGGSPVQKPGYAIALGSELTDQTHAADRKGFLVSFPTGIVRGLNF